MKVWLGLLCGALIAAGIACGGATQKSAARSPVAASAERRPIAAGPEPGTRGIVGRNDIDELDRQIDADLARLGIEKATPPPSACVDPPCDATALSVSVAPSAANDPTCKPGAAETCKESCRLSDSICSASQKICRIAGDLGGGDRYANEKCETAKVSCARSHEKCCGCL